MVKVKFKRRPNQRLKGSFSLKVAFFLLLLVLLPAVIFGVGCNTDSNIQPDKPDVLPHILRRVEKPDVVSRLDYPKTEVPSELFIRTELRDGVFLGVKEDTKSIYAFELSDRTLKKLTEVKSEQKYINLLTIVSNSEWVVWVEDEAYTVSNKPFQWQIIAYNVATGEKIPVDESPFLAGNVPPNIRFNVPPHVNFSPDAIAISEENIIVYCMSNFENHTVFSELVKYCLNSRSRQVIARTGDVTQELIAECAIYGDNIVWSRFRILNDCFAYRFTRYKYSDLFKYNLKTGRTVQLTVDDFYHEPYIDKNKLVALYVTPNRSGQAAYNSEVVFMDLDDRQFKTVVHEDSPIYQRRESEMLRTMPRINSRYISWWFFRNRYVYDYRNNRFIELFDGIYETLNKDNAVVLDRLFDNHALFNVNFADGKTSKYLVTLQPENCTMPRERWLALYQEKASAYGHKETMEYGEAVAEYKAKIGYDTMINSAAALEILLPAGFYEVTSQVEIGPFLRSRNELSKQSGFNFADYMGKTVVLYTCSSETDDDLVLLIYAGKIIGAWKDSTGEDFHFIRIHTSIP